MILCIIIVLILIIAFCLIYFDMKRYKIKGGGGSKFTGVEIENVFQVIQQSIDSINGSSDVILNKDDTKENIIYLYPSKMSIINISLYGFLVKIDEKIFYFIKLGQTSSTDIDIEAKEYLVPELFMIHSHLFKKPEQINVFHHTLSVFYKDNEPSDGIDFETRINNIKDGIDTEELTLHKTLLDQIREMLGKKFKGIKAISVNDMQQILNSSNSKIINNKATITYSNSINKNTAEYYNIIGLCELEEYDNNVDKIEEFNNLLIDNIASIISTTNYSNSIITPTAILNVDISGISDVVQWKLIQKKLLNILYSGKTDINSLFIQSQIFDFSLNRVYDCIINYEEGIKEKFETIKEKFETIKTNPNDPERMKLFNIVLKENTINYIFNAYDQLGNIIGSDYFNKNDINEIIKSDGIVGNDILYHYILLSILIIFDNVYTLSYINKIFRSIINYENDEHVHYIFEGCCYIDLLKQKENRTTNTTNFKNIVNLIIDNIGEFDSDYYPIITYICLLLLMAYYLINHDPSNISGENEKFKNDISKLYEKLPCFTPIIGIELFKIKQENVYYADYGNVFQLLTSIEM